MQFEYIRYENTRNRLTALENSKEKQNTVDGCIKNQNLNFKMKF